MKPIELAYWLQGAFELAEMQTVDEPRVLILLNHVALVRKNTAEETLPVWFGGIEALAELIGEQCANRKNRPFHERSESDDNILRTFLKLKRLVGGIFVNVTAPQKPSFTPSFTPITSPTPFLPGGQQPQSPTWWLPSITCDPVQPTHTTTCEQKYCQPTLCDNLPLVNADYSADEVLQKMKLLGSDLRKEFVQHLDVPADKNPIKVSIDAPIRGDADMKIEISAAAIDAATSNFDDFKRRCNTRFDNMETTRGNYTPQELSFNDDNLKQYSSATKSEPIIVSTETAEVLATMPSHNLPHSISIEISPTAIDAVTNEDEGRDHPDVASRRIDDTRAELEHRYKIELEQIEQRRCESDAQARRDGYGSYGQYESRARYC